MRATNCVVSQKRIFDYLVKTYGVDNKQLKTLGNRVSVKLENAMIEINIKYMMTCVYPSTS